MVNGLYQPQADWFYIHLPNYNANVYKTVGDLRYDWVSSGPCAMAFFTTSDHYRAVTAPDWAEYDYLNGTYYGNPDPPEPECPPNCPQAVATPTDETLSQTVEPKATSALATGIRSIPAPNPRTRADAVRDLKAGIVNAGLEVRLGLHEFVTGGRAFRVGNVTRVESLSDRPSYFLIQILRATGEPYASATVVDPGWLGAITLSGSLMQPRAVDGAETFRRQTGRVAEDSRAVFLYSSVSATEFQPMYLVSHGGDRFLVTRDRRIFQITDRVSVGEREAIQHFAFLKGEGFVRLEEVF